MKKSFISLFLLTLILSHFSILNLLASGQLRRIWKYAAMILLCMTVGLGEMWGAHQYILPVTSTTSYGGSSVERKIDNNTWVVYEANNYDNWVNFHLNVASANNYFLYVGVSSDREGNFRPFTNDTQRGVHGFSNSGWNNVRETDCGTNGVLQAGDNKISIRNNGNNFNLYYIRLADAINTNLTVPSDLGIYFWEVDGRTKTVNNSDFSYSNNSDYMDYNGFSGKVAFKSSPTTATSRYNMVFPTTGKYQFIFPVYVKDNGTYSYPTVRVNSESTASGSITTVENNKLDSIILELDVSAGTYPIYIDFPATDKVFYRYVSVIEKPASCTAPNHVDVTATAEVGNYGWRYSIGETLKLTATPYSSAGTGSPITSGVTYQWKKKTGATTWKDLEDGVDGTDGGTFSGTTSANLVVSGLTASNAGTYKCVASTGSGCDTESNEFWVRVFTFNGNYSGSSFVANPIVWTDEFNGTATVTLNANSVYEFKVTDNDSHWYGKNTPINKDEDNFWIYRSDDANVTMNTGKVTGTYTFTVNIYHANDDNNPYCTLTAVRYPKMTIYMSGGNTTWCDASPVFFAHTYGQAINDVKMTAHACESGLFYADVPSYNTKVTFTRQSPGSESIAWDGGNFWNKSKDEIVIGSNNMFTCTGWDNNEGVFSGSTFSPSTYTISFESNGSDGGSAMSNVTAIPCGEDRTLVANTWEKSGYTFTGWKTNVAISTSAGDIAADGIVPNEATIQDITQNITLTAQWAEEEGCVSRYVIECEDNAYLITPTSAAQSCPGEYIKGSDSGYWSGFNGQYIEHKNSAGNTGYTGEMYYLVNLPNTATYSFIVRTATKKNQWINIYGVSGSDGSHYVTYNNVTYKKIQDGVRAGVDNENQTFVDVNTTTVALDAGTYVIGLYGESWATWDRFIITDNTTYTVQYATGDGGGTSISAKNTDTEANIPYNTAVTKCTNVTFTAGVAAGYRVNYWTVNDVRYTAADGLSSFSMDISQDVTVKFYTTTGVSYNVTVNRNNNDYGTASADAASYSAGSTVHISATPQPGYRFVNWTTSDPISIVDATSASTTFTMIASAVTVQANFEEISCWSSRTYQVEDIMITTAGAVTDHDTQATPSNVMIITSDNKNNYSNAADYFASISDGAFVYNTQAGSAVYMEVDVSSAGNYTLDVYSGKGQDKNVWVNVYTTTSGSGDHISYGGTTYYKQYNTQLNKDHSTYAIKLSDKNDGTGVDNKEYPTGKCIIGIYTGSANCALDKIVLTRVDDSEVFCKHTITVNNTSGASSSAIADKSKALSGETVTVTAYAASDGYRFTGWTATSGTVTFDNASSLLTTFVMPDEDVTLTANYALDEYTISELPWAGDQDLTGQTVVSAEAINSCFDTEITFTFTGGGTVNYYDNTNRSSSLGTVTSGTAITLTDDLREYGIYIRCTEGAATLTAVSKTTIGSVYEIWSAARSKLGAVAVGDWSEQVVLGPEHFQTAAEGDVLRVNTSSEGGDAQGALQYILTDDDSHTYKGLDNSTSGYLHNWDLTSGEKDQHYFEITIDATHLANLKRYGVIVKGRNYTIQSVELRASCSNRSMRTTAPDIITYGDDESINIMTGTLEFEDEGFDLGNWEHKLELDESCFTSVTVGSVINLYMSVDGDATLSFRCNVDSVHAQSYDDPPLCPSYGDISFDRTIDDLYGDAPAVVGATEGYKVLYLLVDADMERRLKETGMILCGKGTLIKVVEGVEETVIVNSEDRKEVPTVVNNLTIYQGGEVTNDEDIEVLGKITYIRPAKGGALSNKLDQWYTFALPFTVSDIEVLDVEEEPDAWYDINAVNYTNNATDQSDNNPDGPGHFYLQYLSAENVTAMGSEFADRWKYITPDHSLYLDADAAEWEGSRYGYPKKDSAYIILFDSDQPIGSYFQTNTQIRFVGGPQTIDGVAKEWKIESDGEQYWMYANNTLHSFTLTDAYILNGDGTKFVLQESPTIRPFECYVQATASLKEKCAAISMRGFRIDNTTTGAESIQGSAIRAEKILRNGQLIIIRNGVEYDATGVVIR